MDDNTVRRAPLPRRQPGAALRAFEAEFGAIAHPGQVAKHRDQRTRTPRR